MRCVKRDAQRPHCVARHRETAVRCLVCRPPATTETVDDPTATKPSTLVTFCTSTVEPVPCKAIGVVPLVVVHANVELTAPG